MSELALKIIEENKRTKYPTLDLGNCGLTELPDLSGMDWVETLILSSEWWEFDDEKWQWIVFGSKNSGLQNRLKSFPHHHIHLPLLKKLITQGLVYDDVLFEESTDEINILPDENPTIDWHFLEKLTGLITLNLSGNEISDVYFLKKMTTLTSLNLSKGIRRRNARFVEIRLYYSKITDWRFFNKLANLTSLDISYNQISDGRFLEKLTNLTSLNLSNNEISDGQFLEKLTRLTTLDLSNNKISHGRFLEKLTNLTSLNLYSNKISDWRFLEKLTNLKMLNIGYNKIYGDNLIKKILWKKPNDIYLEKLTGLNILDLSYSQISNWQFLEKLTNLTSLNLSDNEISDGQFLGKLSQLTVLDLRFNKISNWQFLENLKKLTSLDISFNQISDGYFLEELTQLTTLNISSNVIRDWRFLEELTQLTTLDISSNEIEDWRFLEKLPHLIKLDFNENRINDLKPFLPLIKRGVPVTFDRLGSGINFYNIYGFNPINPPIKIIQKGNAAILEYFSQKEKADIKAQIEAKKLPSNKGEQKDFLENVQLNQSHPDTEPYITAQVIANLRSKLKKDELEEVLTYLEAHAPTESILLQAQIHRAAKSTQLGVENANHESIVRQRAIKTVLEWLGDFESGLS